MGRSETGRKTREYCMACARLRRGTEYSCPACGSADYDTLVRGMGQVDLVDEDELEGKIEGLLEGHLFVPPGTGCLLYGERGIGKTSLAMLMFPEPWILATEMEPKRVRQYARRLGVTLAGVSVPTWDEETKEIKLQIPEGIKNLVCDSINGLKQSWDLFLAVEDHMIATGARCIFTAQTTKDGKPRGDNRISFDLDSVVLLCDVSGYRQIVTEKHRFGDLGSFLYQIGKSGIVPPKWTHKYSVEGKGPRYTLAAWPFTERTFYSDVLKTAERSEELRERMPLDTNFAVAAKISRLYGGGWVEPPDLEARQAFCRRHGLTYWSPVQTLTRETTDGS